MARCIFALLSLSLLAGTGCQERSNVNSPKSMVVPLVVPVSVYAFERIEQGAKELLDPAGYRVRVFSSEGESGRFGPTLEAALAEAPPFMLIVGTQLTNTFLGDKFNRRRPPFVATAIFNPSALDVNGRSAETLPRMVEMGVVSDSVTGEGTRILQAATVLIPHVKSAGILTNKAESNSMSSAKEAEIALESGGITVHYGYLSSAGDLTPVTKSLLAKGVDFILIPHDKIAVQQASTVVDLAYRFDPARHRPVLSLDEGTVAKDQVLACVSADYYAVGREAARLALSATSGQKLSERAVVRLPELPIMGSERALARLGLPKPLPSIMPVHWIQ